MVRQAVGSLTPADTEGLGDVELGAILAPVHQGHQELVGSGAFGGSAEIAPFGTVFQSVEHFVEGFRLDAGESFEVLGTQVLDIGKEHNPV
jgi:hypothetical protein